jgi:dTDP-4-dehydrorhamnose reductase
MTHSILIFGEHGQLARALARTYSARGDVVRTAGRAAVDIGDRPAVMAAAAAFRPHLVVNAAAYTAVDRAEDEAELAFRINRDGAGHVAAAARQAGAPVIHVSTDYVFDGEKRTPYVETDAPAPLSVYGRSKLAGEQAVAAAHPHHVIVRTSWLCSPEGSNFVKTMLRLAAERREIAVVDDQWGAPTFAADLAEGIAAIGDHLMSTSDPGAVAGVYHATGSGATTWCRFAAAILGRAAAMGAPSCHVRPIATADYPTRARRPANSRLDCNKLAAAFGVRLPPWESALDRCLEQLIAVT